MALEIKDGSGSGFSAKVGSDLRLRTDAIARSEQQKVSDENGSAAFFNSTYSATGGEEVIYVKNTETLQKLYITRLRIQSTVPSLYTLFRQTSGTAAGTALVYLNPNLSSGVVKQHTSFGNASVTGTVAGTAILVGSMAVALTDYDVDFGGSLILGNGDAIAITLTTSGVVYVTLQGYWR